jgi:hypothetical protein
MRSRSDTLANRLSTLEQEISRLRPESVPAPDALDRWRSDAHALLFHLRTDHRHPPLVAMLGGTGTGKSTVVNRLLDATVSATSFRRTFTTGAVAITRDEKSIPDDWLRLPRQLAPRESLPAKGEAGSLVVVPLPTALTNDITLIDTPDLDGDQPAHHAEADRVFRFAESVVFLVTPEKYQMTELLPYYRLARRYGLPALFVMNKCEESVVVEDYRKQLAQRDWPDAPLFVIARDDAGYEPPPESSLASLRTALAHLPETLRDPQCQEKRRSALAHRSADLLGRLRDQILSPLRDQRREIDRNIVSLRALNTPPAGVDVSPATTQLQRRLQEQSILYLIGPQRVLDRARQLPGMLARLPRTTWDLLVRGEIPRDAAAAGSSPAQNGRIPDFPRLLSDQFTILQSRIEDTLRSSPASTQWLERRAETYARIKLPAERASRVAEEEIADLRKWLEQRWHGTPRDTRIVQKLLGVLPGGKHVTKWSEAAPYLLTIVVATHHAFFGPIDLLVLGSYSLATWLGEKLSNEVTSRTRDTNRRIGDRFASLAREQIDNAIAWLDEQAPSSRELDRLDALTNELSETQP